MPPLIASDPIIGAKFSRAAKHAIELKDSIAKWVDEETELVIDQSGDLKTASLRLIVSSPPRLPEWSVILGDTVHNLRSALDVWMYKYICSTYSGELHTEDKDVYFPIFKAGKDFRNWKAKTGIYLSDSMTSALLEAQPYRFDIPLAQNAMWLIHQFDIADKHREPLVMNLAAPSGLSPFKIRTYHPDYTENSIRARVASVSITEGGLMVVLESDYPLHNVELSSGLKLVPYFEFEGGNYQLMHTLREFLPGVQNMIRRVETAGTSST
ncbi:hypothetical protein [Rhodococcus sp. IEGM 1307]|jgi:hypothetical protein|uniref:hypothetical protein n=1 Tax=Rhodococcus sp. IEGM 1307 TaxID=3047091 RepID=UPI0024B71A61|nr:hypothetical protein [Rhodococcus sp. IEGM 1307]MDI9980116.1 hypothetical protein [Rhodococcus sp. IEGM 1307]